MTLASPKNLATIVLAAGGSTRLGTPKQMLRYRSEPLIARTVRLARQAAGEPVVVVLGYDQLRLRRLLQRSSGNLTIAANPAWRAGIASSMQRGLDAVPQGISAVLILLVDQIGVDIADLERLVRAWRKRPSRPAAARYDGSPGVPAILPRQYFRQIHALAGDVGARQLLRRAAADEISSVDMPSASFDIDTPRDLQRMRVNRPSRSRRSPESHS